MSRIGIYIALQLTLVLGLALVGAVIAVIAAPVPEPDYRCDFSPTSPNHMTMDINGTGVIGPFDAQHPWTFWNQHGDASFIQTDENHGNQWLMWAQDILGRKSLVTLEFNNVTSSYHDVVSMFAYDEGIEARNETSPLPTNKWMSLLMVVDRTVDPSLDPPSLYYYVDGQLHAQDSKDHKIIWDQKAAQFSLLLNTRGAVSLFELYDVALTGAQAQSLAEKHVNTNTRQLVQEY